MAQSIKIPNQIKDEEESIFWLKRITSYVVSTVLYLRKFLDEEAFLAIPYETIKLRVLSKKCQNQTVHSIIGHLEDCFKALEEKALKSLTIGIFEKTRTGFQKNATEVYHFDYENLYSADITPTNLKVQTRETLRNLIMMLKKMKPLPGDDYYLLFKLSILKALILNKMRSTTSVHSQLIRFRFVPNNMLDEEVLSFSPGTINSSFHALNVSIEAESGIHSQSNVRDVGETSKQAKVRRGAGNTQHTATESSESESEKPVSRRRKPPTAKGLLNIGKRKVARDAENETKSFPAKRRLQYPSSSDQESGK